MKFKDIPQFTRSASYVVNIPWNQLEETLKRYNDRGTLELNPEFQRAHVWSKDQRRRYVEFILRGGKSSRDIYFNQSDWGSSYCAPMYLVDGKQRIEAVLKFLRGELGIFVDAEHPSGYKIGDFEDRLYYGYDFIFHVNDLKTYVEVLTWYLDLNAGGVAHTDDEIAKVRALLEEELSKKKSKE